MALVTTVLVMGVAALIVWGVRLPERLQGARANAELTALVDSATAELVQERLSTAPLAARVFVGHRMHGPFLDIQLHGFHLHLRLYRDANRPFTGGQPFARLTGLALIEDLGWVATFDGPRGPQRYLGWLVESVGA
jgi:hypothetical protein